MNPTRVILDDPPIVAADATHSGELALIQDFRHRNVYPYLAARGFAVTELVGEDAIRSLVEAAASRPGIKYLTCSGHGERHRMNGHANRPVFQVNRYPGGLADGKIVHLLACLTAQMLGPDLVEKGARAYFGYSLYFVLDLNDPDEMLECDAAIDRGFADGHTAGEVYDMTVRKYEDAISAARRESRESQEQILEDNLRCLCAPSVDSRYGTEDARLD